MRSLGWNPNETAETEEITEDEKREFQKLTDKVGALAVGVAVHLFYVLLFSSPLLFICFMYSCSHLPCCSSVLCTLVLISLAVHLFYVLLFSSPLLFICFMYSCSHLPCCSSVLCTLALISLARLGIFCNIVLIAEYSWWLVSLWLSCKKPGKSLDMTGSYFQQVQTHHKSEKLQKSTIQWWLFMC